MNKLVSLFTAIALLVLAVPFASAASRISHVLVISIDGLHAFDLRRYVSVHPHSALAALAANGIEYSNAHVDAPADSFPGLIGMFTSATPAESGVYYDVSYDRTFAATLDDCRSERLGTRVTYDETIDAPSQQSAAAVIDPMKLPRRPGSCVPVYPHDYLRVNTVFEVVRDAGSRTAWIDKHPVYEILNGPSGHGVDDLYTPEIGGDFEGRTESDNRHVTGSVAATEDYDAEKVLALRAEIAGWRHDHTARAPVPTLFGTNLQALNVAQKLDGYADAQGTPSPEVANALAHCDRELADIIAALRQTRLYESTLLIVTAKHGNGPVDRARVTHIEKAVLRRVIDVAAPGALAQLTTDQSALIWLRQPTDAPAVAHALRGSSEKLGIRKVLVGPEIESLFPAASGDSRVPDVIVIARTGVIYGKPGDTKLAEHGGFDDDNTHVALLLSNPHLAHRGIRTNLPVSTRQIAPTILAALVIPTSRLDAERKQPEPALPFEDWGHF